MPTRKNKLNTFESSRNAPIAADNVGRKLLEKMGWESGLGLGRDNQGMIDNPLWKRKNSLSREGFKSKEEMAASEILPHQNAFEDLLGELNEQCSNPAEPNEIAQQITCGKVQKSKTKVRYFKMAHAKDVRNYSIKDFNGIIGKVVTKKNLNLLCGNGNDINRSYEEKYVNAISKMSKSSSDINTQSLKVKDKCCSKQIHCQLEVNENKTEHPSFSLFSTTEKQSEEYQEISQKKRRKHIVSNSNVSTDSEISVSLAQSYKTPVCLNNGSEESFQNVERTTQHCVKSESKKSRRRKEKKKSSNSDNVDREATSGRNVSVECDIKSDELSSKVKHKQNIYNEKVAGNVGENADCHLNLLNTKCKERDQLFSENREKKIDKHHSKEEKTDVHYGKGEVNSSTLPFISKNTEILQKQLAQNPYVLSQISDSFVGSNLEKIKGYGNW